eukprot:3790617-Rhodomonas_salina.3
MEAAPAKLETGHHKWRHGEHNRWRCEHKWKDTCGVTWIGERRVSWPCITVSPWYHLTQRQYRRPRSTIPRISTSHRSRRVAACPASVPGMA